MNAHAAVAVASCLCAALATLLLLPSLRHYLEGRRRRWLGLGLLPIVALAWWPLSGGAGRAELGALLAALALAVAAPLRDRRGPAAVVGAWVIATAAIVALDIGVDLERLRGGPFNALLTAGFLAAVAFGVEGVRAGGAYRASGVLTILSLLLVAFAGLSEQQRVFAVLLPLGSAQLAVHLLLIPPRPERPELGEALPALAMLLAWCTLELRFSDSGRLGALAAPLLWSVPALIAALLLTLRRAPKDAEVFGFTFLVGVGALLSTWPGMLGKLGAGLALLLLVGVALIARPVDSEP